MRRGPEASNPVLKVINLKSTLGLLTGILSTGSAGFVIDWNYVISKVFYAFLFVLFDMINGGFLAQSEQSNNMSFFWSVFLKCAHDKGIRGVVKISASSF